MFIVAFFYFNIMKLSIILFTLITFTSCDLVRLLNTSEQKDESANEIHSFLSKHKYKYDYSFENIDSTSNLLKTSKYRINNDSVKYSFIQLRIYSSNGKLYSGYSQCMGDFNNRKIIEGLPPSKNTHPFLNSLLEFNNELDLINISSETKSDIIDLASKYDYTFIVYWTIWTNYFSKHVLREVSKIKSKYPDKVLVILVNTSKDK